MNDILTVRFITVDRQIADFKCDSVRVPVADSLKGEFSGSYGIRKGHAKTVFSLGAGRVILTLDEKTVFEAGISDGFATVENNEVCITVDNISE